LGGEGGKKGERIGGKTGEKDWFFLFFDDDDECPNVKLFVFSFDLSLFERTRHAFHALFSTRMQRPRRALQPRRRKKANQAQQGTALALQVGRKEGW